MGGCVNKNSIEQDQPHQVKQKNQNAAIKATSNNEKTGIHRNANADKSLLVQHSPLRSSGFLFQKFRESDGTPQQISLGFMLTQCKIDIESRSIQLSYMTTRKSKIWCVYGGIEKISETGLTIELKNYIQIEQLNVERTGTENMQENNQNAQNYNSIQNSNEVPDLEEKKPGESIGQLTCRIKIHQKPQENILIVFEPFLQNGQTIFMIYRYQILPNEKQYSLIMQTLQWSSLAFRINDIYGADSLFRCDSENELCSVCLSARSECILLPCRHMCICETCLTQIERMKPRCPLCRKEYYSVIKYKNEKRNNQTFQQRKQQGINQ